MRTKEARPMRVDPTMYNWVDNLSKQLSKETGLKPNKQQTMRLIAQQLDGKITFKGLKVKPTKDFRIL